MRQTERQPALVCRRVAYGEADLILGLFCRDLGRVSAVARNARRSQKRFGGALGLFTLCDASIKAKSTASLWSLESAVATKLHAGISTDLTTMAHASYGTELVEELLAPEQPEPAIFDLLLSLLQSLEGEGPKAGRLRVFELTLLRQLGLSPVFDRCVMCGQTTAGSDLLIPSSGGIACRQCAATAKGVGAHPLSSAGRELLLEAQSYQLLSDGDRLPKGSAAVEARTAMLSLVYWHVGKPLKSVEFVAKLANRR